VTAAGREPRVVVLADDLIWATRLADGVRRASADAVPTRTPAAFATALPGADGAIVDLTARAYDGIEALGVAREAGVPVIAVGQHDDVDARRAARAAGATKVYPYRALFEHGDRELGTWIASIRGGVPAGRGEGER
jgi:DNA-binding response OmpR family regulator